MTWMHVHTGENRGVKQAGFMVLTTARRPAMLVEMGYSTNPQDARLLTAARTASRPWRPPSPTPSWPTCSNTSERPAGPATGGVPGDSRRPGGSLCCCCRSLGGCVYYNGMYNANRLARAARKAEREGRPFDATSLWGQVGVKADSVLARHPHSKYADAGHLLRGHAMSRWASASAAVAPLSQAGADSRRRAWPRRRRSPSAAATRSWATPVADLAFRRLLDSPDRRPPHPRPGFSTRGPSA